ncbi:MAG: Gfo/Idh/MocA family oxidoreductase [Balneolaceae bacterium]|nr:Gfo/Idh/MocA family oxidoreductase [Balneolaceae bacterium]
MAHSITRKDFLVKAGSALAVSSFGFPSIILPRKNEKLGVALVGLGNYSTNLLAPGLLQTKHCELRGIVTGSPEKIPVWQERYGIKDSNVYNYGNMYQLANNDDIDVVYIVLPNHMHAEYSIIGAEAGKHVWCEKPMAMNAEECREMIRVTKSNRVQLTIGYRMQHEPNTQTIIKYGQEQTYGEITEIRSGGAFNGNFGEGVWRTVANMGGGAMYDMGVYPLNAARYSSGLEPVAVRATQWTDRTDMFPDVDEHTDFDLEFPGGLIALCKTSFGKSMNYLEVDCTDGWYRLEPFLSYDGVQGETSSGTQLPEDPNHQQARQMDNDALAIKNNTPPIVPGEEGLADMVVVDAIFESAANGGDWIQL